MSAPVCADCDHERHLHEHDVGCVALGCDCAGYTLRATVWPGP